MKGFKSRIGFTLTEVLVSAALSAVAVGMATVFLTSVLKTMYLDTKRGELNGELRMFTARLAKETIDANDLFVLTSYKSLDGYADLTGADGSSAPINVPLAGGESGDCLVLVYRDKPMSQQLITRIRVYFRESAVPEEKGVLRTVYVASIPDSQQSKPLNTLINTLIPNLAINHASQEMFISYKVAGNDQLISGVPVAKAIFYNDQSGMGQAVSVNCRIEVNTPTTHGNTITASAFNFTISPRK